MFTKEAKVGNASGCGTIILLLPVVILFLIFLGIAADFLFLSGFFIFLLALFATAITLGIFFMGVYEIKENSTGEGIMLIAGAVIYAILVNIIGIVVLRVFFPSEVGVVHRGLNFSSFAIVLSAVLGPILIMVVTVGLGSVLRNIISPKSSSESILAKESEEKKMINELLP